MLVKKQQHYLPPSLGFDGCILRFQEYSRINKDARVADTTHAMRRPRKKLILAVGGWDTTSGEIKPQTYNSAVITNTSHVEVVQHPR